MWLPSFFRNVSDSFEVDEYEDEFVQTNNRQTHQYPEDDVQMGQRISLYDDAPEQQHEIHHDALPTEGELAIDIYQTPDEIVVRTMIPGIEPGNVDIALTREILTVSVSREEVKEVTEDNYFARELAWGTFSRTVSLPAEVEVDEAQAEEHHGVLTIRLPKINKERQTKLRVKTK